MSESESGHPSWSTRSSELPVGAVRAHCAPAKSLTGPTTTQSSATPRPRNRGSATPGRPPRRARSRAPGAGHSRPTRAGPTSATAPDGSGRPRWRRRPPRRRRWPAPSAVTDTDEGDKDAGRRPATVRGRRRSGRDRTGARRAATSCASTCSPAPPRSRTLEGRNLVEHYGRGPPTRPPRSTATSTWAGSRTCCRAWRRRSSTSGSRRTACSTEATSSTTSTTSSGGARSQPRIEEVLRPGQTILCQVTKNPIGAKGARLTQEVSLPGRFVVLVPNSSAFGISKRLGDNERRRLRRITDEIRPPGHGLIVRTAAEGVSADELRRDVNSLVAKWTEIERALASGPTRPASCTESPTSPCGSCARS